MEDKSKLADTMGTAMQMLFQSKLSTMQSQKAAPLPAAPNTPPPTPGQMANPATVAATKDAAKEQEIAKSLPVSTPLSAVQALFPEKGVGNNTSAASILSAKI